MANGAVQAGAWDAWLAYMAGEFQTAHGGTAAKSVDDILNDHLAAVVQKHGLIAHG